MPNYLLPQDDGLPARVFGPWVAEKLDYLARYINMFETSMRDKPWRKRHYIDLFAGSGKCCPSEKGPILLGSPLLALTTEYPFTDFFFVEAEQSNVDILKTRCGDSPLYNQVWCKTGDGNILVQEVVKKIPDSNGFCGHSW